MPDAICNTSPLQYLHQIGHLDLLPQLAGSVVVPNAVCDELHAGLAQGIELPKVTALPWIHRKDPISAPALPLAADLGPGESAVLALALVPLISDRLPQFSRRGDPYAECAASPRYLCN